MCQFDSFAIDVAALPDPLTVAAQYGYRLRPALANIPKLTEGAP